MCPEDAFVDAGGSRQQEQVPRQYWDVNKRGPDETVIEVVPNDLRQDIRANKRMQHDVERLLSRNSSAHITYEELLTSPDAVSKQPEHAFGIKVELSAPTTRKQGLPLQQVVSNYADVVRELDLIPNL